MALNAKMLGNALANRSRGLSSDASKQINPGNMPINNTPDMPPVEPTSTFDVPVEALQGVVEGDVLTVTAVVGDKVTLTKEPAAPVTEPTAPPIQ
jgi:hypothetical protein